MEALVEDSSVESIFNVGVSMSQLRTLSKRFPGKTIYTRLLSRIYR